MLKAFSNLFKTISGHCALLMCVAFLSGYNFYDCSTSLVSQWDIARAAWGSLLKYTIPYTHSSQPPYLEAAHPPPCRIQDGAFSTASAAWRLSTYLQWTNVPKSTALTLIENPKNIHEVVVWLYLCQQSTQLLGSYHRFFVKSEHKTIWYFTLPFFQICVKEYIETFCWV